MFQAEAIPCITSGEHPALGRTVNSVGLEERGPGCGWDGSKRQKLKQALLLDPDFALELLEGHFISGISGSILISVKIESYQSLFKKENLRWV